MNDLLSTAIKAHGGLDRWSTVTSVEITASITGAIWYVKGKPDILKSVVMTADTRAERLTTVFRHRGDRTGRGRRGDLAPPQGHLPRHGQEPHPRADLLLRGRRPAAAARLHRRHPRRRHRTQLRDELPGHRRDHLPHDTPRIRLHRRLPACPRTSTRRGRYRGREARKINLRHGDRQRREANEPDQAKQEWHACSLRIAPPREPSRCAVPGQTRGHTRPIGCFLTSKGFAEY